MSRTKRNLVKTYARQGRLAEAVAMYILQRGTPVYRETLGLDQASTGEVCNILAELYEDLNDAEDMATQALQIFEKSLSAG